MNKLFKFAGVSALSLIVAAPNAFGAYGRYDAICTSENMKKINFLTAQPGATTTCPEDSDLESCVSVKYNNSSTSYVYYDTNSNKWYKSNGTTEITTAADFFAGLKITDAQNWLIKQKNQSGTGEIQVAGIKTALVPYAALFFGDFATAKSYVYPAGASQQTTMPFQSITTGSTCSLKTQSGNYNKLNVVATGTSNGSGFSYGTIVLPKLLGDTSPLTQTEQTQILNSKNLYYVIRYAADCISTTDQAKNNATCNLSISSKGAVSYSNACNQGCSAANGGFASPMDSGTCGTVINPTMPASEMGNTQSGTINDTNLS